MKDVVALLPLKKNSERVKNKNIRLFNGIPLFQVILNTLLQSRKIDQVVINTDSDEIKEMISEYSDKRILMHDRPAELQGDLVSMNKIIEHDINLIPSSLYLQTHSTNPLLDLKTIEDAIEIMKRHLNDKKFDSLFSVTEYRTRFYDQNGKAINHDPNELIRTQDLPPYYEENSNIYLFTKESFVNNGNKRIGREPCLYPMNETESIDIDIESDFIYAEYLHQQKFKD